MSWRYYRGADGRRFNFATAPTFCCALADPDPERPAGDASPWGLGIDAAAIALELPADDLAAILRSAHRIRGSGERRRIGGKLTDECAVCGRRMERRGFRAWIDDDFDPKDASDVQATNARIAARLGGAPPRRPVGETRWFDTKREAREWAREESLIHVGQAQEAPVS